MRICKSHPARRETIEVWRRDFAIRIKTAHVAVAEIVAEDEDDIRPLGGMDCSGKREENKGCFFHDVRFYAGTPLVGDVQFSPRS